MIKIGKNYRMKNSPTYGWMKPICFHEKEKWGTKLKYAECEYRFEKNDKDFIKRTVLSAALMEKQ